MKKLIYTMIFAVFMPLAWAYADTAAVNFQLASAMPSDTQVTGVAITAADTSAGTTQTFPIAWGSTTTFNNLKVGDNYTFTVDPIVGLTNTYNFTIPAASPLSAGVTLPVTMTTAPTVTAQINLALSLDNIPMGYLPHFVFHFQEIGGSNSYDIKNISSLNPTIVIPAGTYQLSVVTDNWLGLNVIPPSPVEVSAGSSNPVALTFIGQTVAPAVKGWPWYLAMGSITDDNTSTAEYFDTNFTNAMFKYEGNGQGDQGSLLFPYNSYLTAQQAQTISIDYQKKWGPPGVLPVMVIYTANMSYYANNPQQALDEFSFASYLPAPSPNNPEPAPVVTNPILLMHFINLAMAAGVMESFDTAVPYSAGSIILNPDFMGKVEQDSLIPQINQVLAANANPAPSSSGTALPSTIQSLIQATVCFMTIKPSISYTSSSTGWTGTIQGNYMELFNQILTHSYGPWAAHEDWNNQVEPVLYAQCTVANPPVPAGFTVPAFTNDITGWAQANNWLVRSFGPDVTFGWQENVWAPQTADWVRGNYSNNQIINNFVDPVVTMIQDIGTYSSPYTPDFIVFDKYEMNDIVMNTAAPNYPGAYYYGFLFNARDWDNYLAYVKGVSEGIGTLYNSGNPMPAMLWQIPGGHIVQNGDTSPIGTSPNQEASTAPDYFFGDATDPLINAQAFIAATNIGGTAYSYDTPFMNNYLMMNESGEGEDYTWQESHIQQALNSHVFAILWGGGYTTSPGPFPAYNNDGGWLQNQLMIYFGNPAPIQ